MTAELLRSMLHYDKEVGIFTWIVDRHRHRAGTVAGSLSTHEGRPDRWQIEVLGKTYFASRLAWLWVHGRWPNGLVDHRDRDTLNNQFNNLREADECQNSWNSTHKPGHKHMQGVHFDKRTPNRWRARIVVNKKTIYIGPFATEAEAHKAYKQAAKEKHGSFYSEVRHPIS